MPDAQISDPAPDKALASAETRRKMRLDRQARVGLLRNPNRPPLPRPRRAAIMGRWLNLRSSRRGAGFDAAPEPVDTLRSAEDALRKVVASDPPVDWDAKPEAEPEGAMTSAVAVSGWAETNPATSAEKPQKAQWTPPPKRIEDTVARGPDGGVQAIDVAGLAAAVETVGSDKPIRTPYGAGYRPDQVDDPKPGSDQRPFSIFSPEAWMEDDEDPQDTGAFDDPAQERSLLMRALRAGIIVIGGLMMAGLSLLFLLLLGPVG